MAETPEEIKKHVQGYLKVGYALFAFTIITWAISYVDLGSMPRNITVGLMIAGFKASLVALVFMHLSAEKSLIYKVLLFTAFFFMGLMFLSLFQLWDPIKQIFVLPGAA